MNGDRASRGGGKDASLLDKGRSYFGPQRTPDHT